MVRELFYIDTEGMFAMENDFGQLATPEPYDVAKERMNVAADRIFARTQAFVPAGKGDKRRPAGALRDSGRVTTGGEGDEWTASIQYGTDDDTLPYAVWARWKHFHNTGVDYMSPTEDPDDSVGEAMSAAFDDVFRPGE